MGDEVKEIQRKLRESGDYMGHIDGVFGGGTEFAVRTFQRREGIADDGMVGPDTWKHLFPQQPAIAPPEISERSLNMRCLSLTGGFETSLPVPDCFAGITGDFDGQGLSFGALQWNLGQGSLQPLLNEMLERHPRIVRDIFGTHYTEFVTVLRATKEEQLEWARSLQNNRYQLSEPWHGLLKTLGRHREFQEIELSNAGSIYERALRWCGDFGLRSERAVALMYDIRVQNGSISDTVRAQIMRDFETISADDEAARLVAIANRRSEAANKRWVEDVRTRKLTIARGEGRVHGRYYDLETQYGIRLDAEV